MPTIPQYVDKTLPDPVYRREGYAESFRFIENTTPVSFGPGGWSAKLELYAEQPRPGYAPKKVATHTVGSDATIAVLAIPAAELALLLGSDYYRQVWVKSPTGEEIIVADSKLLLRS